MATYQMQARPVPLEDEWDVVVAGGGPAGCTAAAAAARAGARTLLVEATGSLGGMGTSGLVPWWCGLSDGKKIIARGLAEHVVSACNEGMPHVQAALREHPLTAPAIDPERLKRVYDDLVTSSGAEVRFGTQLTAVEREVGGDGVDAVILSSKAGLTAVRAPVYVDCTGDADLAAWAGAEVEKGDEDGGLQPATHCFVLTNVDEYGLQYGTRVHFYDPDSPMHKALASDKYPLIVELHSCSIRIGPGAVGFNTGHVFDVDNTDPRSISRGLVHGRRMAAQYRDALAEFLPAFANSFLAATGSLLGIRETRRIVGDYRLDLDDYQNHRAFEDEICRNAYGIDVHRSKAWAMEMSRRPLEEIRAANRAATKSLTPGQSMGVPYRCLTPKGLRNVLVAGRCISTDRQVNGTVRIMACCLNTGEAAGAAAAMAAAAGSGDVHAVDTAALRGQLKAHGAFLPDGGDDDD